jgi:hypothetical protein
MTRKICPLLVPGLFCLAAVRAESIPIDPSRLDPKNVQVQTVTYRGTPAIHLTEKDAATAEALAVVKDSRFRNGSIEVDVSGAPGKNAQGGARGFLGVAFRMQGDGSRYELLYIRPTNGRADDQLRRNHTTQYVSAPDWPWERLRKESPGVYESYTDVQPGEWTHLRIVVQGTSASLYVGGAEQPCLLVHDLKLGDSEGAVALWIGPGTDGYFRDLKISGDSK